MPLRIEAELARIADVRGFSMVVCSQISVAPSQSSRPSITARLRLIGSRRPEPLDKAHVAADVSLVQAQGGSVGVVERGGASVQRAADGGRPEVDHAVRSRQTVQFDVAVDGRRLGREAGAAARIAEVQPRERQRAVDRRAGEPERASHVDPGSEPQV